MSEIKKATAATAAKPNKELVYTYQQNSNKSKKNQLSYPIVMGSKVREAEKEYDKTTSILVSTIAGLIMAILFLPYEYYKRGYIAIGGEWIVIVAVVVATYQITKRILNGK